MPRLAIVLVDYNGLADTRACLESLARMTAMADVIVVDNASKVNVADAIASEFPSVRFLRSDHNGGWAGGNNLGLRAALDAGADLVALLNNDTTVEPTFAARLIAIAESHPEWGIFGPVIRDFDPPHAVQTEGVRFNSPAEPGFFQRIACPIGDGVSVAVDIVNGCCLVVRREVVEKIGVIDDDFFLIHEESDFCLRAKAAGFQRAVVGEALVFHKQSSTFAREGKALQRYYDSRNLIRLLRRHSGGPSQRGQWRSQLHAWRYCLSRYAIERENGFTASADAVLEGLYDAIFKRYGCKRDDRRIGFGFARRIIAGIWRLKRMLRRS
jgi:GT2 family glycosyltransferase